MSWLFDWLGYRRRWRVLGWFTPAYRSASAPVVVGGCGGSGTTLLRQMLNRHPAIDCRLETTLFLDRLSDAATLAARLALPAEEILRWQRISRSQTQFIEYCQAACLAQSGKRVWAEKTPENIRRGDFVRRHFPLARIVHIVRDGRDVACSLRAQSWMKLRDRRAPDAIVHCVGYWLERVAAGRRLRGDPRFLEIRYEDLVQEPEATLRRLIEFLDLAWDARLLHADAAAAEPTAGPLFNTSIGRWRRDLTPEEQTLAESAAAPLLDLLGYERASETVPAAAARVRAAKRWRRVDRIRIEAVALVRVFLSRAAPWYARLAAAATLVAYDLTPFDPIPDRIPVIGHLDDAIAVAVAAALFAWLVPAQLLRQERAAAAAQLERRLALHP